MEQKNLIVSYRSTVSLRTTKRRFSLIAQPKTLAVSRFTIIYHQLYYSYITPLSLGKLIPPISIILAEWSTPQASSIAARALEPACLIFEVYALDDLLGARIEPLPLHKLEVSSFGEILSSGPLNIFSTFPDQRSWSTISLKPWSVSIFAPRSQTRGEASRLTCHNPPRKDQRSSDPPWNPEQT